MIEIALGAMLIIISAALAEKATPKGKKWLWALFVVLVVTQAVVQMVAHGKDVNANEKLRGDVTETKTTVGSSLLEQGRMSGKLGGIQAVMENLSKSGWPGMKEFASAMTRLAETQTATNGMTNKQLCGKSIDLAKRLRALHAKQRSEDDDAFATTEKAMAAAKTPEERNQIFGHGAGARIHANHEYELSQMLGDIVYIRDALQQKLPSEPKPDLNTRIVFSGHLAGSDPLIHAANYFDVMARRLCAR